MFFFAFVVYRRDELEEREKKGERERERKRESKGLVQVLCYLVLSAEGRYQHHGR